LRSLASFAVKSFFRQKPLTAKIAKDRKGRKANQLVEIRCLVITIMYFEMRTALRGFT